jgi:SPP1 family predicted phage head-tail adaptor
MIQPGKMRETITIEAPSGAAGSLGQVTYETFATVRAELRTLTGRELNAPQLGGSQVSHVIVTRYIPCVKADMRVFIGDRLFIITHPIVVNEGNARLLEIYVREVLTAGPWMAGSGGDGGSF